MSGNSHRLVGPESSQPPPKRPALAERLGVWLPSRGNVLFTMLVVGLAYWFEHAYTLSATPIPTSAPVSVAAEVPPRSQLGVAVATNSTPFQGAPQLAIPVASAPPVINYQGTFRDAEGNPLSGTYTMTLRIYANVADPVGSAHWAEEHRGVTVRAGHFSVVLGNFMPFPADLFNQPDRFIGVTVQPYTKMLPRQRLASVPYARNADLLDGQDSSAYAPADHPHSTLAAPDGDPWNAISVNSEGNTNFVGNLTLGQSALYFTDPNHMWSGWSEQQPPGYAAIENAADYNALLIAGRTQAGGRRVSIYDHLYVNSTLSVADTVLVSGRILSNDGKPAFLVTVDTDDCRSDIMGNSIDEHPYLGCPAGYEWAGSWYAGYGNSCRSDFKAGHGYENGFIRKGWMALCMAH